MDEPVKDLDAVNRELAEVVDALNNTPSDDFAARHALRTRQDELRELAAGFRVDADEQRSTEDLRIELAARESQINAIYGSGIDMVTQAGGGSGTGGSYTSAAEGGINRQVRDASGAGEVQARIARLREILADRGED
jgi:hypothetical protein